MLILLSLTKSCVYLQAVSPGWGAVQNSISLTSVLCSTGPSSEPLSRPGYAPTPLNVYSLIVSRDSFIKHSNFSFKNVFLGLYLQLPPLFIIALPVPFIHSPGPVADNSSSWSSIPVPGAHWNMWQRSPRAQFSSVVEPLKTLVVLSVSNSLLSPFPLRFLCLFACLPLNHLFLVTLIVFYFAFFVCLLACYTVHRSFPCSVLSCMMFLNKLTQFWFLKTSFI